MTVPSRALAVLSVLLGTASFAQAQNAGLPNFMQNLPAKTVIGNLRDVPGIAAPIPFASLAPLIAGISVNSILFKGATSGTLTFSVPAAVTSYGVNFPAAIGTSGQGLSIASIAGGVATLQWSAATGTVDSGLGGNLAVYTAANKVAGAANVNLTAGQLTVGVAGTTAGTVLLAGATSGATTLAGQASGGGTMTFQAGSDTVVGRATTDTLTNKTLTSPIIVGGTVNALTSLSLANSGFNHAIASGGAITANRTLTINNSDGDRTLTMSGNINVASGFSLVGSGGATLTIGGATSVTLPASGTLATLAGSETLTNKTLTTPIISTISNTGSLTLPTSTDTLVGRATTDTLTNKTLTAPTINGGTHTALTLLGIRSTGSGAFDLTLANTENLTAGRTLTLTLNNAPRLLSLSGDLTTAAAFSTAGANALTLTTTTPTNVTLPASGTLMTINTTNTVSATNTFSALQQFTDIKFSSGKLYPTADSTTALAITKADATTAFVTFDSTNKRVGINKAPTSDLDVSGTIKFTTLDGASLGSSPTTITDLTINNSPNSSNDYILYYNAAAGAIRRCTVGSCAAAATAGVSSLNGLTGGLSIVAGTGIAVAAAGTSVTPSINYAAKADQQAATSAILTVNPSQQQSHPSAAKAWCMWVGATAGTNACTVSYNVTNVTRNSTGNYNVNFTTAFSTANYVCAVSASTAGAGFALGFSDSSLNATSAVRVAYQNSVGAAADPTNGWIVCYGTQ